MFYVKAPRADGNTQAGLDNCSPSRWEADLDMKTPVPYMASCLERMGGMATSQRWPKLFFRKLKVNLAHKYHPFAVDLLKRATFWSQGPFSRHTYEAM